MDVPTLIAAVGLAAGLVGAVLAAAGLAALIGASRGRLRRLADEGVPAARRLAALVEQPAPTVAALAASDVLLAVLAVLCALAVAQTLPSALAATVLLVGAVVLLLLTHAVAWAAAVERPEALSLALAGPIQVASIVARPLVGWPAAWIAGRFWHPLEPAARERNWWAEATEEGEPLEKGEERMIHGIVELGNRTVREVMVPRIDMVAVPATATVDEVLQRIRTSGHSRIPVYGTGIDDIVGIIYAKDLLHEMPSMDLQAPVGPLVRAPLFVPETKRVDELLHEMQEAKVHIAIVVDEYGGTAGLITIEDLLEEIVGEIRDEYDVAEESWIEPVGEHEAVFDGRVSIHDVNTALGLALDDAEYDTLGGLVYARLGKVPAPGDSVEVDNARVTVLSTLGRRVRKVRVAVATPPSNGVAV
ncbi:MAG: HlyC/CorC family transporter [Chloroflexi bacterium]|nr:HlyC/CorC family transporter [Chloroflexota bacterium]